MSVCRRLTLLFVVLLGSVSSFADEASSLKVLLITGGCCHDYDFQSKALQQAAKDRGVEVEWKVVNEGGKRTAAMIDLYKDKD